MKTQTGELLQRQHQRDVYKEGDISIYKITGILRARRDT